MPHAQRQRERERQKETKRIERQRGRETEEIEETEREGGRETERADMKKNNWNDILGHSKETDCDTVVLHRRLNRSAKNKRKRLQLQ